jgi:hypothetical protein
MTEPILSEPSKFSPGSKVWGIPGLVALLMVVVILSWPGMQAPLFSDDFWQVDQSSRFVSWKQIFQYDAFGYYRPVKNALFMVAEPLRERPIAWHLLGLVAYLAATVGVFRITWICLGNLRAAWIATAIWALSPSCVSTVLWLSCANISIGLVMSSIVFECHERAALKGSSVWLLGAWIAFGSTLLCYEAFIALPGLLFLRDLQQRRIGFDRRTVIRYGLYTLVAMLFLLTRAYYSANLIGGEILHAGFSPNTKAMDLTLSAPWFLWRHFLMWVCPFGNLEVLGSYEWLKSASIVSIVLGWVFLIALLSVARLSWHRYPAVSYGLLFFVLASIPAGNFLPTFNGPIYDVYLTIPSIGLALVVTSISEKLLFEASKRRREIDLGASALLALFILVLVWRLPICGAYFRYWAQVWSQPIQLLLHVSDTRPHQFLSKGYASNLLFRQGYYDQAEEVANEALKGAPWNSQAKLTLARIHGHRGHQASEEAQYKEILLADNLSPELHSEVNLELAESLAQIPSRRKDAVIFCRATLQSELIVSPVHLRAVICLSGIYEAQGLRDKSIATLQKGLLYHRENPKIQKLLDGLKSAP